MAQKAGFGAFRSWSHPSFDNPMIRGQMWPDWPTLTATPWINLSGYPRYHFRRAEILTRPVAAALDLELALGKPLRAHQNLPGNADQVGGSEFRARTLIGVVVEHVNALGLELAIKLFAGRIGIFRALLQVQDHGGERRHGFRPLDGGIVVAGFNDGADQARHANTVGAAMDRHIDAIGSRDHCLHGVGIFGAEIEDLADFDAAGMDFLLGRHLAVEPR